MHNIEDMNETQQSKFLDLIKARISELQADLEGGQAGTATVTLDQQAIGRLSRQDALINQAMANAGQSRRRAELTRLNAALQRLEEGDYGYCEDCGDDIPPKRLELDLAATRCVSCASR